MPWPYSTPHVAPLYPELPYPYRGIRKLSVYCRCDRASLAAFLPPEFELLGDVCEVFVMQAPDAGALGSYDEAGLVIPVRYDGTDGAHVSLEYVTTDDALCAGREIWGYPKKLAAVTFDEGQDRSVRGHVSRRGQTLIDVQFTPADRQFDKPLMQPRLQVKLFARADGQGLDYYQIVRNDLQDLTLCARFTGDAELQLGGNADDPLHRLGVRHIVGAELVVSDFLLTHGRILADLAPQR